MGGFIPQTESEQKAMLKTVGANSVQDLFADIPSSLLCGALSLPEGKSELETRRVFQGMANQNKVFNTMFRGAGAYRHYIPSIVKQVTSKETFVTAYTPYQAEISQGVLQAFFEYQTEICAITGMDVSNASVYDGASAAAEAAAMCRLRGRQRVLVSATTHPDTLQTIATYCASAGVPMDIVPAENGRMNHQALAGLLGEDTACLVLQSPNFYGLLEETKQAGEACHAAGAKFVYSGNPIAMALLETPAEAGADIAVGEGQPLGLPLGFGGPYLGFMACTKELMRRLPGRIVGQTTDAAGKRCFVLTLQAREQHIRREKAGSSICSNQALCALTASVYLAAMGPKGLAQAAQQCYAKAHYAAAQLEQAGYALQYPGEFFHEFVTSCPADPQLVLNALEQQGILGGLPVENGILWCCTEMNTKQEIDTLVDVCRKVAAV